MRSVVAFYYFLCITSVALAQTRVDEPVDLRSEIQALRDSVAQIRQELAASRKEAEELRRDLQALREKMAMPPLEEQQVINAKLDEQQQSKVASGSKYRVRLSGMALFNGVAARGAVD